MTPSIHRSLPRFRHLSFVHLRNLSVMPVAVSNFAMSIRRTRSPFDSYRGLRWETYTGQLGAAVTALGGGSALLDVQDTQLTTGRLDDASPVGGGVVAGQVELFVSTGGSFLFLPVALPTQSGNRTRGQFSPVTASVGNTVARHFDGLTWNCRVERLTGRNVGRLLGGLMEQNSCTLL